MKQPNKSHINKNINKERVRKNNKKHSGSRNVLVLAQQGQMQQNLQGLSVRCHDNEFAHTTIQSFSCLVGALLELLVVASLPKGEGVRAEGVTAQKPAGQSQEWTL